MFQLSCHHQGVYIYIAKTYGDKMVLQCQLSNMYVKLKDRKRSLSGKNNHVLWHYRNSYNAKFCVVAVFKQLQRIVACEDMP